MRRLLFYFLITFCLSEVTAQTSWSQDNSSDPLNGIWYLRYTDGTMHPVLDVYLSNGRYTVNYLGRDILGGEFRDSQITGYGDKCDIMVEVYWNHRDKLREKGWSYYVEDCDSNADAGFPSYGQYKYNEDILKWYFTVDFSRTPLTMKFVKVHTDSYLNGVHTYSETDFMKGLIPDKILTKKH